MTKSLDRTKMIATHGLTAAAIDKPKLDQAKLLTSNGLRVAAALEKPFVAGGCGDMIPATGTPANR